MMERCPECFGELEECDDYLECIECGAQYVLGSEDDDYEEIDEDERY